MMQFSPTSQFALDRDDIAIVRAKDSYLAYTRALRLFHPDVQVIPEVHPSAVIDDTAIVWANCEIGPNVVIGKNCRIAFVLIDGTFVHGL